ncbi:MAG: OsmC family protein [Propionibacteriaceae bacterium]|nr:OsmC family protein [Propionibacteriaceae bacterium]
MTDTDKPYYPTANRISPPEDTRWWVERTGRRSYLGHNDRGSTVLMADSDDDLPGSFTPGELLRLALAGCAGMTFDNLVARHLGEDFPATVVVDATPHAEEDRYESFQERVLLNTAGFDEEARKRLADAITRAISRGCTVGLTLKNGAPFELQVEG